MPVALHKSLIKLVSTSSAKYAIVRASCPNICTVFEGFLSCSIAMAGFLGNVGSAVILSGKGILRTLQNLMLFRMTSVTVILVVTNS